MRTTRGEWGGKIRRRDVSRTVTHRVGLGKRRNQTYRGGLVRRLITACNEFEWLAWRARNLSLEKGVRYARRRRPRITRNYRVPLPPLLLASLPFSLSLFFPHQPFGSPPPVPAASNPTPRSALSNVRPPFPYAFLRAQPFQSSQIISAITKPRGKGRGGSKPVPGLALENPSETNRACSLEIRIGIIILFLFFYTRMCRRNAFVSCARLGESWEGRGRRVECVK